MTFEKLEFEEHFLEIFEDKVGKFKIRLSLKIPREHSGDSKSQTLCRYFLERKFSKNQKLNQTEIQGYISQNHMKLVSVFQISP